MSAARALAFKAWRHARNVRVLLRSQSSLKLVFVLTFAVLMEVGLYLLFLDGFRFFSKVGGAGGIIIDRLFSVFFFGMATMLVVSGVVTSYATIFRSEEVPFLLVRPFEVPLVVTYKFLESTAFSSWAFFVIVIPFAGAYATHQKMSPLFALWTLLYSAPLLLLCSGVGALVTLAIVRWLPRARLPRWCALGVAAAAGAALWRGRGEFAGMLSGSTFDLSRLVPGLSLAANPLMPSWWTAEGITALSRGQWTRGALLASVLLSSAMMVTVLVEWVGGVLFCPAWERAEAGGRTAHAPSLLPGLRRALAFLPGDARGILVKDVRTFLRDPMQWSQALVFFGLLSLYFANLRTFQYHVLPEVWRSAISLLNVFSVSAVMCSLGSRFIYPQLSLEGQSFWILGLSPARMRRILLAKFSASAIGVLAVTVGLTALSGRMLQVSWQARLTGLALSASVALVVCALSTGLGAIFLDLKQRNPSAIVSGFGGTLNLVLSLAFMLAAILPFGLVFHARLAGALEAAHYPLALAACAAWLLALTAAGTVLPLWLAARSLERREF
jgi:ABC-2 type transport system permease protein